MHDSKQDSAGELTDAALAYWASMPGWQVSEAAALFVNIDPDQTKGRHERNETSTEYKNLKRRLLRAKTMGSLESPLAPKEFLEWAESNGLPIPDRLREAVTKGERLIDWQRRARRYLDRLRKLQGVDASIDELQPKSLKSLYRIVLAVVEEKYSLGNVSSHSAASNIEATLTRRGFDGPKAQTIASWLSQAREAVAEDRTTAKK